MPRLSKKPDDQRAITPTIVLKGRFVVEELISEQSDNNVFRAYDLHTASYVVVKAEKKSFVNRYNQEDTVSPLYLECEMMKYLETSYSSPVYPQFFPKFVWHGKEPEYNLAAFELMGTDLLELYEKYGMFSDFTRNQLGAQMLVLLEAIHRRGVLHQDIKPNNFVIGRHDDKHLVYLIDFGHAVRFAILKESEGWGDCKNDMMGNCNFTSIRWHNRARVNVWDDLEMLGYTLYYFKQGTLPWMGRRRDLDFMLMDKSDFAASIHKKAREGPFTLLERFLITTWQRKVCIPDYKYWIDQFRKAAKHSDQPHKFEWL